MQPTDILKYTDETLPQSRSMVVSVRRSGSQYRVKGQASSSKFECTNCGSTLSTLWDRRVGHLLNSHINMTTNIGVDKIR